jgi:hypothetical protein
VAFPLENSISFLQEKRQISSKTAIPNRWDFFILANINS